MTVATASSRLRWGGSFALALLLHAVVIGAALWWSLRTPPLLADQQPLEAVMVDLAETPEAPPTPPTEIPQGPPQQEQQRSEPTPAPRVEREPPPQEPEVVDAYVPPQPREHVPASDAHTVDQTLAPPDVSAKPSERYAARQTTAGQQAQASVSWQGQLLGHLEKYRRYPRLAERLRQQGVAYVRFSVDRQGRVSNARIGRTSGHDSLDEATLETLARATPVPVPPADVAGDPVEVMVPVEFFINRR